MKPNQIISNQSKSYHIISDQIKPNQSKWNEMKWNQFSKFCQLVVNLTIIFLVPSKPMNFRVRLDPSKPRTLNLSWDRPGSYMNSISHYEIHSNTGGQWKMYQLGGTTTTLKIKTAKTGTKYNFKLRARDSDSWGEFTDVVSVTTINGMMLLQSMCLLLLWWLLWGSLHCLLHTVETRIKEPTFLGDGL